MGCWISPSERMRAACAPIMHPRTYILRHIALNLLKQEKMAHLGIHAKRLKAGWQVQAG